MEPKYKNITVKLVGEDGNVFNIIGLLNRALRQGGIERDEISRIDSDLMASKSYDQVLQKIMSLVNVR
jgi:hypothetical protein